jgi:phosphoglycerate dehydrogenase-like enzyme
MVIMGGGPETPSTPAVSKEKELVLAVLPWPKEQCQPGIDALEKEFSHLRVQHFYSHFENGNITVDDIPPHLLAQASYIATLFWLPETPDQIPKTELIQFFSAGTNHVANHPIYTDSKIPLCSANGVHGPQIAEWVVMMDLVHSHGYTKLYDLQRERRWDQRAGMGVSDRVGKRVGVLGYGSIGRQGE